MIAELEAIPKRSPKAPGSSESFPVYRKVQDGILVPKFAYFRLTGDMRMPFDIIEPKIQPEYALPFAGALQPDQIAGVVSALQSLKAHHGVFIKGRPGSGKTVIGTFLIHKIPGQHAVVLVDQTAIADQWTAQVKEHLPSASISYIMPLKEQKDLCAKHGLPFEGREHIDAKGRVIIAMAETLMRAPLKTPIDAVLLIVDEAHKFCAKKFSQTIFDFNFRYSVALTATDERDDGLDWIFKDCLGTDIADLSGKRMRAAIISMRVGGDVMTEGEHRLYYCRQLQKGTTPYRCIQRCHRSPLDSCPSRAGRGDKMDYSALWIRLSQDATWNAAMAYIATLMYQTGRDTIVFSKFKDHLKELRLRTIANGVPEKDTSLFFGGMDKDEATSSKITFATYGVCQHAIDIPRKDAALFAMPIKHVEQSCGRIERFMEGKPTPIIIDPTPINAQPLAVLAHVHRKFYERERYGVWHVKSFEETRAWLVPRHPQC